MQTLLLVGVAWLVLGGAGKQSAPSQPQTPKPSPPQDAGTVIAGFIGGLIAGYEKNSGS